MTDADLEKHTDILAAAIKDVLNRVGHLTPDEVGQKELATEMEDLLLIVDSQRRSIRLTQQTHKDRELRKEKELQETLAALAQLKSEKETAAASPTTEQRSASPFTRRIGDYVPSFFVRQNSGTPSSLSSSQDTVTSDSEGLVKTDAEKVQTLKESNEAMFTILTKLMDDNTHLIEDIEGLIREKKRLESQIDTWTLKYNTLESKFKEAHPETQK